MASGNVALAFAAVAGGAIVIDYGIKSGRAAFAGSPAGTTSATAGATSSSGASSGNASVTSAVTTVATSKGWSTAEIADWMKIIGKESGGNPKAYNSSSGAALIGQFLPMNYGKYGPGSNPADNPTIAQQVESMGEYIADRYGTPSAAWQHELSYGWY